MVGADSDPASHHVGPIRDLCIAPDGDLVTTVGDDKAIRVWSVSGGSCDAQVTLPKKLGAVASTWLGMPDGTRRRVVFAGDKIGNVTCVPLPDVHGGSRVLFGHTASIIMSLVRSLTE